MPNFESGVASYIAGQATVEVFFPVDAKGRESINCRQCQFLSSNEKMCQLNKRPVAFPAQYVGNECPLERKDD